MLSANPFTNFATLEDLRHEFYSQMQVWAVEGTAGHACIRMTVQYLEACKPFIAARAGQEELQVRTSDEFERVLYILKDTPGDFRVVHDVIFPCGERESRLWYTQVQLDDLARLIFGKLSREVRIPVVQQPRVDQIDDELNQALQHLFPVTKDSQPEVYRVETVSQERIFKRKLAAALERSLAEQGGLSESDSDHDLQMAIEQSELEEALRQSLQDFMQE